MRKHPTESPLRQSHLSPVATAIVAGLGLIVVSTWVSGGVVEAFRAPKEIAFRTEAIVLLLMAIFAATSRYGHWRDLIRGITPWELGISAAIVGWTVLTTLTSTNRLLSEESCITVIAAVVIFLVSRRAAPELPLVALDVCLLPAVINAIVVVMQESNLWNPFTFPPDVTGHTRSTALLGHPNDVGTYLLGPAVAAIVATVTVRGWRRWMYAAVAPIIVLGIIASGSRTAIIAGAASMLVFAMLRPWKQALVSLLVVVAALANALAWSTYTREHFQQLVDAARTRQYDVLSSERLVPALAAAEMARAHPITGVGPGCFKFHYMDERLALSAKYPQKYTKAWPQNFGETHNDHLQVTAESGLPGYGLFLAAVLIVAVPARRAAEEAPWRAESAFVRAFRPPLAVAFFVVALAQFPLQIAAPRTMFLTLAALALGWDHGA